MVGGPTEDNLIYDEENVVDLVTYNEAFKELGDHVDEYAASDRGELISYY